MFDLEDFRMKIHTAADWKSGMAAMKNMALSLTMAREESRLESLKTALRDELPEPGIWKQIWSRVTERRDHLLISLPGHHKIRVFEDHGLRFEVGRHITFDVGQAFVLADKRIRKLLRREGREKWSCWQWFIWLASFTLAEIP